MPQGKISKQSLNKVSFFLPNMTNILKTFLLIFLKCMIKYEEVENSRCKLIIYSFLPDSDDKTKAFEAWKPKQFTFEPLR